MDATDEQLVARCQRELPYATLAFEALLRRHDEAIFSTCRRYLGNDADAEDAAQDVYIRIFHGLKSFRGDANFRTWLYRVVSNVCATRYAKKKKQLERLAAFMEKAGRRIQQEVDAPEVRAGPAADALDSLEPAEREIIVLRHVSELSVPEISEVLGVSLSAAKMRVSRAEKQLKHAYEEISGKVQKTDPEM